MEAEGAEHNETAWAARTAQILEFLFPKKMWDNPRVIHRIALEEIVMKTTRTGIVLVLLALCTFTLVATAQERGTVLTGKELTRVVPTSFYFQGQSAPTQVRNSAAARFGGNRYVIVGMVDTSGYAADTRAKYEGFFITDSAIEINGHDLKIGAYGFGFSNDGKMNLLDLSGKEILSASTTKDTSLQRPRPLMMTKSGAGVRLYSGRDYVMITPK